MDEIQTPYIIEKCDDLYIMTFIKYLLKLLHEYKYVADIPYYILTNNTYKISEIIKLNKYTVINTVFGYVNSYKMFDIISNNIYLSDDELLHNFNNLIELFSATHNIIILYNDIFDKICKGILKDKMSIIISNLFYMCLDNKLTYILKRLLHNDNIDYNYQEYGISMLEIALLKKNDESIIEKIIIKGANVMHKMEDTSMLDYDKPIIEIAIKYDFSPELIRTILKKYEPLKQDLAIAFNLFITKYIMQQLDILSKSFTEQYKYHKDIIEKIVQLSIPSIELNKYITSNITDKSSVEQLLKIFDKNKYTIKSSNIMHKKYIKYKTKYLQLKKQYYTVSI